MAQHAHLVLKRLEGEFERRKPKGFGGSHGRDHDLHGNKIAHQVAEVLETHANQPAIEGIDPSLILRIEVDGFVDEAEWARMGLTVLSEDPDKTLLLFSNDRELTEFRRRLEAYQGTIPDGQKNHSYAGLIEAIEKIGLATAQDRIGESLANTGISAPNDFIIDEQYLVDIELFHPGNSLESDIFLYRLDNILKLDGGIIINTYSGENLLLCRVQASGAALRSALELPEVAMIELPPRPDLQQDDLGTVSAGEITIGTAPAAGAIAIGVIDSGVNSGHPLLVYASKSGFVANAAWADADEAGHGTSVASMAAYGDISARVEADDFDAPCWIASARVVDSAGDFPKEITVPELMEKSIRSLHIKHQCRIFNISLGDPKLVFKGGKPGIWASKLDELARDLDVLIVVSTGNLNNLSSTYGEGILKEYPSYLLEPESRILDPATAANVLTVGSIAHANGLDNEDEELVGVRPICIAEQPSPFTRTGPGIRGMIKPDLVDYGGNAVWDGPTQSLVNGAKKSSAGVWTFHHEPVNRLFRSRSGTSFSAPIVSHKAALILSQFPGASANFIRAMLALSAEMPDPVLDLLEPFEKTAPLMICGHGIAEVSNALSSDDSRVVFYANDIIKLDHFAVFELPVPPLFQTTNGAREIKVSLAFDPPVRRTRAEYLGLTMGWRLLRGASQKDVFDRFRKWEAAEGDPPEFPDRYTCKTNPGSQLREKGTLQCGSFPARRNMSAHGDTYYVAIWCRRRWAPETIKTQRFSVAVQLRHSADIQLYQALKVPIALKA